jgi:hypothetical protein
MDIRRVKDCYRPVVFPALNQTHAIVSCPNYYQFASLQKVELLKAVFEVLNREESCPHGSASCTFRVKVTFTRKAGKKLF